ncbi:MAG: GFA family protein [Candidatus Puniceispirillaceae bacterium]|jgi:hypothetical protein
MAKYKGGCFCGEVQFELADDPVAMLVCHCRVCRGWSAAPVNGASLFKPEDVTITKGAGSLRSYAQNEGHERSWCEKCGGHVLTDHRETYGIIDVYASVIEDFTFAPTAHVNYESTIMPMRDGLPKFKDFPAEMGGSGDMLAE